MIRECPERKYRLSQPENKDSITTQVDMREKATTTEEMTDREETDTTQTDATTTPGEMTIAGEVTIADEMTEIEGTTEGTEAERTETTEEEQVPVQVNDE